MHTLLHSVLPALQQDTADSHLCRRLLDTCSQVWVSLLWGHCSFLLHPAEHEVLFVPSKSLLPQSCVSFGSSMVELMVTSYKRAYAIPRSVAPRAPAPVAGHCWPTPPQETLKHRSVSVSVSLCAQGMFEPSELLWQVWGLNLNVISPLLQSCWGFSFALGCGVSPQSHSSTTQPLLQHCVAIPSPTIFSSRKFFKRWEYQTTLPASWETCMQVKKQHNWKWNNRLIQNWERSVSRLYIVTLLI